MESIYTQLYKIAKEVRHKEETVSNPRMAACCATASYLLWNVLTEKGFKPIFVLHEGEEHEQSPLHSRNGGVGSHCFIICNGYVIDITATQYNLKQKVIVNKQVGKRFWFVTKTATTSDGIKRLLLNWPPEQKPIFRKNKLTKAR